MVRRVGVRIRILLVLTLLGGAPGALADVFDSGRHPVADVHPRLLGTRDELRALAVARPQAYERTKAVAKDPDSPDQPRLISQGIVAVVENDADLARAAISTVMGYVKAGVRVGHVPFGHDVALGGMVFDMCYPYWKEGDRRLFVKYLNETAEANRDYGSSVFHNGWWGYKNWGLGVGAYATYHENEQAKAILAGVEREYREKAGPALELAGAGGGWAEGYYIHYFLYDWLFFCEIARRVEGVNYYRPAPGFYSDRARASIFEMYPGMSEYNSRRPVPMGDGGGRTFGGDRDKALSARRILATEYGDRLAHAYNEQTPRTAVGANAYMDLLWRNETMVAGVLDELPLSHHSTGAGHIHARSDWSDDATYLFFKASDRYTSHQHLDAGHFVIFRKDELLGDGGHYESFGGPHDVNYHMRSIAHSTLLVHDPAETWPAIRGGEVTGNDGGQHHRFPHHNGAVETPEDWRKGPELYDLADVTSFEEKGSYLHVAADLTRAYAPEKVESCTRQIVYLRPSTFVVFDRVRSTNESFKKSWVLQAMAEPERDDDALKITRGGGRLIVRTLLPENPEIRIFSGDGLYRYDGQAFPPTQETPPAPVARIHISPPAAAKMDYFLHVLHAGDADGSGPGMPEVSHRVEDDAVLVEVAGRKIRFATSGEASAVVDAGAEPERKAGR